MPVGLLEVWQQPGSIIVLNTIPRMRKAQLVALQLCVFDEAAAGVLVEIVARVH